MIPGLKQDAALLEKLKSKRDEAHKIASGAEQHARRLEAAGGDMQPRIEAADRARELRGLARREEDRYVSYLADTESMESVFPTMIAEREVERKRELAAGDSVRRTEIASEKACEHQQKLREYPSMRRAEDGEEDFTSVVRPTPAAPSQAKV